MGGEREGDRDTHRDRERLGGMQTDRQTVGQTDRGRDWQADPELGLWEIAG